jgi:hypothetical protein
VNVQQPSLKYNMRAHSVFVAPFCTYPAPAVTPLDGISVHPAMPVRLSRQPASEDFDLYDYFNLSQFDHAYKREH